MVTRIGINGFGRIGRNILRAFFEEAPKGLDIVAINDVSPIEASAFLLEHDTSHGHLGFDVKVEDSRIISKHGAIHYSSCESPSHIDWGGYGVDIVFECTGAFSRAADAKQHLHSGAKKVIISAPSDGADITVVFGVNQNNITQNHHIISAASCTTNCLAPLVKVLDELCGIQHGFMTTIHAFTQDQRLLDSNHSDLYRARAANQNIIPTSTGAAKAVGLVIPQMAGKIDGVAVRVPTPNVSLVDFVFMPEKKVSVKDINHHFIESSQSDICNGVLAVAQKPLVSSDFNHNSASSIFDSNQTRVLKGGLTKVFSWYDNEWGFSNRMLDIAQYIEA